MNKTQKHTLLAAVSAGMLFAGASAQASIWDGGGVDSDFATALNWDDDLVQVAGNTTTINNGDTVIRNVDSTTGRLFIEDGSTLNVTGGAHSDSRSGNTIRNFVGRGSAGTVNQSAGSYDIGHLLTIGGGGSNGNGAFNLTGGNLIISRGGNSIANTSFGSASLDVSDEENAGSGLFEISNAATFETRVGVVVGQTGTFSVVGGNASIGVGSNGSADGFWLQEGTLSFAINAVDGASSIFINEDGGTEGVNVGFELGSILDLGFDGAAIGTTTTWTLMEAENTALSLGALGLAAGDAAAGWSYGVDNSGANGLLTATYTVPEPGAFALIAGALSLSFVMVRRRK